MTVTPTEATTAHGFKTSIGTFEVFVAGVVVVVASTTLVSDFQCYFALGLAFAMAIFVAFVINLLLGLSVAELAVDHPKAGALYEYGRAIFGGTRGKFIGVFLASASPASSCSPAPARPRPARSACRRCSTRAPTSTGSS